MKFSVRTVLFFLISLMFIPKNGWAQNPNPLQPFDRFIGGAWYLGSNYQTFEWGLGEKSVIAKMYVKTEMGDKLVSDFTWLWHPGKEKIIGFGTGIGLERDFFEYESTFHGDTLLSLVWAYHNGNTETTAQKEYIILTDENHYYWQLFEPLDGDWKENMHGMFNRRN